MSTRGPHGRSINGWTETSWKPDLAQVERHDAWTVARVLELVAEKLTSGFSRLLYKGQTAHCTQLHHAVVDGPLRLRTRRGARRGAAVHCVTGLDGGRGVTEDRFAARCIGPRRP